MNYFLIFVVTLVEAVIIYKVRFIYSRQPMWAIGLSSLTIVGFYLVSLLTVNKYIRAYSFSFATINLIFLVVMLAYMEQMRRDLKKLHSIKETDFLLVLGNKCTGSRIPPILSSRLEKAIELYSDCHVKPKIIVSGGRSSDEQKSEASLMQTYLIERGIPEEMILMEDKSTNTVQNLEYSAIKINKIWCQVNHPRVIIVTSDYHIPRTKAHAKIIGLNVQFAAAKTIPTLKWPAMFREFTAIVWYNRYALFTILGIDVLFSLSMCL